MSKTATARHRQAMATKQKIYKAGIRLIQKNGFDGVDIRGIAKAAGVSVGTVYHYYRSKLDLFMDLYRSADNHFEKNLPKLLSSLNFKDQILCFFDEYCEIPKKDGVALIRKIYVPDNPLFLEKNRGMHHVLLAILKQGKKDGALSDSTDINELFDDLFTIARGVVFDWALHDGKYDLNQKMASMLTVYLNATCE